MRWRHHLTLCIIKACYCGRLSLRHDSYARVMLVDLMDSRHENTCETSCLSVRRLTTSGKSPAAEDRKQPRLRWPSATLRRFLCEKLRYRKMFSNYKAMLVAVSNDGWGFSRICLRFRAITVHTTNRNWWERCLHLAKMH